MKTARIIKILITMGLGEELERRWRRDFGVLLSTSIIGQCTKDINLSFILCCCGRIKKNESHLYTVPVFSLLSSQEEGLAFSFLALGGIYQKQKLLKVSPPDFGERLKSLRTWECPEGRKECVCGAGWG